MQSKSKLLVLIVLSVFVTVLSGCQENSEESGLPNHGSSILKDYVKEPLDKARTLDKSVKLRNEKERQEADMLRDESY